MMQAHRSKQRVQHEHDVFAILVVMLLDQETPRKTARPLTTVAVLDPTGRLVRHPGATLTVDDPDRFLAELAQLQGVSRG